MYFIQVSIPYIDKSDDDTIAWNYPQPLRFVVGVVGKGVFEDAVETIVDRLPLPPAEVCEEMRKQRPGIMEKTKGYQVVGHEMIQKVEGIWQISDENLFVKL
jgi:hypothetical protein